MINKNIDSIKGIKKNELKKARKIILKTIGEKDQEKDIHRYKTGEKFFFKKTNQGIKMVDGVFGREEKNKQKVFETIQKDDDLARKKAEKEKLRKTEEEKRKNEEALIKKKEQEKAEKEERERKNQEEKETHEKEEKALSLALKREQRRKRIANLKKRLKEKASEGKNTIQLKAKKASGSIFRILPPILGVGLLAYILFVFAVINFKPTGGLITKIVKIIPVPALISREGIIGYSEYIKKTSNNPDGSQTELIQDLFLKKLAEKYGIAQKITVGDSSLMEKLNKFVISDKEINATAISRINKIREIINNPESIGVSDSFLATGSKYGDEGNSVAVNKGEALKKFGESITKLEIGEVSEVIYSDVGYYIVRISGVKDERIFIDYIFIKGKVLSEYIGEKIKNLMVWDLVGANKK